MSAQRFSLSEGGGDTYEQAVRELEAAQRTLQSIGNIADGDASTNDPYCALLKISRLAWTALGQVREVSSDLAPEARGEQEPTLKPCTYPDCDAAPCDDANCGENKARGFSTHCLACPTHIREPL